jgi:RNA polymerase sigma factor for flagellar operon FliA
MVVQTQAVDIWDEFIQTRSPELRERLVLQSVPLVHYLLSRMGISQDRCSDYEDLAHQGLMGLIDSVDNFDRAFNTTFSTYASTRIRGRILDHLRASDWMPRAARKRVRLIRKAMTTLWSEKMREPADEEIAAQLGMNVEEIRQGLADSNRMLVSLDLVLESDSEADSFHHETLRDEDQVDPADVLEESGLLEQMADAIKNLSERERLILALYYNDELTFKEIGKVLEITESRVCQLHARAVLNLKAMMQDEQ